MLDLTVAGLTQINDSRAPVIQEYGIRPFSLAGSGLGFSLDPEVSRAKLSGG